MSLNMEGSLMIDFQKWPLAVAVSSALVLGGCLGGSGSSSSGGTGGGADPGPGPGELFTYTVSVEQPSPLIDAQINTSTAERLVSAALNSLISQALAQVADVIVQPEDLSVRRFVEDGDDEELEGTEVTEDDGVFIVQSPQGPAGDVYIQVNLGSFAYTVPASRDSLVANPITTLITQQIANRLGQLDELTLDEINELVERIELLAEDEEVRNAIDAAVFGANNTDQLLAALNTQLSAVVNQALDDYTTPAASSNVASNANGTLYARGISIGVFADDAFSGGGGVLTGQRVNLITANFGTNSVDAEIKADEELEIEFVHNFGQDQGNLTVLANVLEEDDSFTLPLDARGILLPEEAQFGPYDADTANDGSNFYCVTQQQAECTDRLYVASSRVSAAGPSNNPFSTMVGGDFVTREVRDLADNNSLVVRVLEGNLEVIIQQPTSTVSPADLSGDYDLLEFANSSFNGNPGEMELESYLLEASFDGNGGITFCEPLARHVVGNLNVFSPQFSEERTDCSDANNQESVDYSLSSNGALELDPDGDTPPGGWLSADGLTFVVGYEDPNLEDVIDAGYDLEVSDGSTQTIIGVKRAGNIDLAGRNYRLLATGANADNNFVGMHLITAGSLRFDSQGEPSISASLAIQNVNESGLVAANNNFPLDLSTLDSTLSAGKLSLAGEYSVNGTPIDFNADGYVQEGGRLIILSHLLESGDTSMTGLMMAVCTNCND